LVFVFGAVSLSQAGVAFNILYLSDVYLYWCVVLHYHLCFSLQTLLFTVIG